MFQRTSECQSSPDKQVQVDMCGDMALPGTGEKQATLRSKVPGRMLCDVLYVEWRALVHEIYNINNINVSNNIHIININVTKICIYIYRDDRVILG